MTATLHGSTSELIRQSNDSIVVKPSGLATLQRTYSCAESYAETALGILIPGHVPDGYPHMALFTKPATSSIGGITTFSCTYCGVMETTDFLNPYITSTSAVDQLEQPSLLQDNITVVVGYSFSFISPIKRVTYVCPSDDITYVAAPVTVAGDFYLAPGGTLQPWQWEAGRSAPTSVLETVNRTDYGAVTEMELFYKYRAGLPEQIQLPRVQTITVSGHTGTTEITVGQYFTITASSTSYLTVSATITGPATATGSLATGLTITATAEGTITITLSQAGNIPSGYDPSTDWRPSTPQYYQAALPVVMTVTVIAVSGGGGGGFSGG